MLALFSPSLFAMNYYGEESQQTTTQEVTESSSSGNTIESGDVESILSLETSADSMVGNATGKKIGMWVIAKLAIPITLLLLLYPVLLILQMIIDVFYLQFEWVRTICLTKVPIPINSPTAYQLTGTQFNRSTNGGSAGGSSYSSPPSPSGTTSSTQQQVTQGGVKTSIFSSYFAEQLKSLIISMFFILLIITLFKTGLITNGIQAIIDKIVGYANGFIG